MGKQIDYPQVYKYIEKNEAHYNTSLIYSVVFCEKYGLTKSSIDVAYNAKHPYVKKISGSLYVDERALIKRREFSKKVWNKAHKNYYLIAEHISDPQFYNFLTKVLGGSKNGWLQFLKYGLFSVAFDDKSILSYKINQKLWLFYRASTFIIHRLMRYESLVEQGKMRRIKSGGLKK